MNDEKIRDKATTIGFWLWMAAIVTYIVFSYATVDWLAKFLGHETADMLLAAAGIFVVVGAKIICDDFGYRYAAKSRS